MGEKSYREKRESMSDREMQIDLENTLDIFMKRAERRGYADDEAVIERIELLRRAIRNRKFEQAYGIVAGFPRLQSSAEERARKRRNWTHSSR